MDYGALTENLKVLCSMDFQFYGEGFAVKKASYTAVMSCRKNKRQGNG